jgi:hypothetical protein
MKSVAVKANSMIMPLSYYYKVYLIMSKTNTKNIKLIT